MKNNNISIEYGKKTYFNELLTENKKIFSGLHAAFGYDFELPFHIIKIEGKYTINQILKAAGQAGWTYTIKNALFAIFTKDCNCTWNKDLSFCTLESEKTIDINHRYIDGIDRISHKGTFNDIRKKDAAITYVIIQNKKMLSVPNNKPEIDINNRYNATSVIYSGNTRYYYRKNIHNIDLSDGNKEYKYQFQYNGYINNISDVIDKSGYIVIAKKEDLKMRSAALRLDRQKAVVDAIDYSKEITELEEIITKKRTLLAAELANAITYEALEGIQKQLTWYNDGFAAAVRKFESFKASVNGKKYRNANEVNIDYANIKELLA